MVFEHGAALRTARKQVNNDPSIPTVCRGCPVRPRPFLALVTKDGFRTNPNPRRLGYLRVSTPAQLIDRQTMELKDTCNHLFAETISGAAAHRPIFERVIAMLRPGDTLVVSDFDRAFRSAIDALLTADDLRLRGVHFAIQRMHLDTASEEGELFYTILAGFAQFERRIISRRTREGLANAKRRGIKLGRRPALSPTTVREAHDWMSQTRLPCRYVAALLGVSRQTLQRSFHRHGLPYPISDKEGDFQ